MSLGTLLEFCSVYDGMCVRFSYSFVPTKTRYIFFELKVFLAKVFILESQIYRHFMDTYAL